MGGGGRCLWTTRGVEPAEVARLGHMSTYATVFGPEPFTLRTAARDGLARGLLRELVRRGQVRRVLRGVYVDTRVPDTVELRARALALVVPRGVVVGLRTAAWLHGVDVSAMGSHLREPPIDLLAPAGSSATRRPGVRGMSGPLRDADLCERSGLVVTDAVRTAADLARLLRRPDALASLDAMFRLLGGLDGGVVLDELEQFAGYRGVVQARELAAIADGRAESPMESRTRLRALDAGFPPFEPQVQVFDDGGEFVARLDLARRRERKGLEYDGDIAHASAEQQAYDRSRRSRVEECGWGLAVVTAVHVLGRGLAFERGVAELLGCEFRLSRHHPRYGGWDRPGGV